MRTLEPIMAEHPFFCGLPDADRQLLVGCASNVVFPADDVIFREGEEADRFFLIRHGKVALEVYVPGHGAMTLQTLGEGEVLGWSWLVPPYRWRFDARAVELTRAIALDGLCLRQKCEEDPRLGYELLKRVAHVLSERLHATRLQLMDVYGPRK